MKTKYPILLVSITVLLGCNNGLAILPQNTVDQQREALADNTAGKGFGPQSPRDIDSVNGRNKVVFGNAPPATEMNLCNIHFHKNAEHRGGEFTAYATGSKGFVLSDSPDAVNKGTGPVFQEVCPGEYGGLLPGDTIEVHYVHTSATVHPGPTLGACLSEAIGNPQLRVEAQVYYLVTDTSANDFRILAGDSLKNGYYQAVNIPNSGATVQYSGSTTGPSYNKIGSPLQVTWNVHREVTQVNINTIGEWCKSNVYNENGPHGVRNLVVNTELLSIIK